MSSETEWVLVPREPTKAMQTAHRMYGDTSDWWSAVIAAAPQPPAEAQPCGCGEATCTVPWEPGCGLGKSEQHAEAQAVGGGEAELRHMVAKLAAHVRPTCSDLWAEAERVLNSTTPPSAPVGVEGLVAKWERVAADDAYRASTLRVCIKQLLALAQQPAAEAQAQGGGDAFGWVLGDAFVDARFWTAGTQPQGWTPVYRTAPPSAPVGVSRYVRDARGRMMRDGKAEPQISYGTGWNACLDALAQQPAAVDGAMVERALSARAGSWSVRQLFADEDEAPDIMRIALTAALAGQQGGVK